MALFDALLTNGGAVDSGGIANAGTPAALAKKRLFDSGTPTIPPGSQVDPNSIPAPDLGQSVPENKFNLPWLPGYTPVQAQPARLRGRQRQRSSAQLSNPV